MEKSGGPGWGLRCDLKYHLHKQHIAHRAAGDGQEHLPLPQVQRHGEGDGDELRQAMIEVMPMTIIAKAHSAGMT